MGHEAFCLNPLHPGPCRGPRTRARQGVRGLLPGSGPLGRPSPAKKAAGRAQVGGPAAPAPAKAATPAQRAAAARKAIAARARAAKAQPPRKAAPAKAAPAKAAPAAPAGPGRGVAAVPGQNTPSNRAATDAAAVAQILMGGGGDVTPQFVEGLMRRVRAAHQRDQREGRGGPDSHYSRLITEEAHAMATVLANRGGGTPAERRQRRNRYANLISEAMRTGNVVPARTLRRELDGNARTASAGPPEMVALNTALAYFGLRQVDLEIYGLDVLPVVPYARAHTDCEMTTFCRNPLHPGPCKGWKKTLAKVAPGALKIIEEERLRKVRERREAREKEKAAGGDKPKPPPRKRTPKPKPEPEKPARLVQLRPETLAAVNDTARSLPRDEASWSAMVRDPAREIRNIDAAIERAEEQVADPKLKKAYDAALKRAQAKIRARDYGKGSRKALTPDQLKEAETEVRWRGTKDAIEHADNLQRLEALRDTRTKLDAMKARGEELTGLNAMWDRIDRVPGRTHYERDPNGVRMPPAALREAEQNVRRAGQALREDINRAVANDPENKRLQAERDDLAQQLLKVGYGAGEYAKRNELRDKIQKIRKQQAERRKALVLDALDQIRPVGGASTTNVNRGDPSPFGAGVRPARADWEERLRVVDQHFPNDWIEQANQSHLGIISSDRAFYYQSRVSAWENQPDGTMRAGTMAMNTDAGSRGRYYNGGFRDDVDEVSVHEMGHRMEAQIAGIKALEYAFIRARTTDGSGKVETRQKLSKLTGNSAYRDAEVAYKDDFSEPYTGKTYESENDDDPASAFWEVFQVGLQQTYGGTRFDNSSLEDFTLGVLATVGRSDL